MSKIFDDLIIQIQSGWFYVLFSPKIEKTNQFFSERLPFHSIPRIYNEFPDNIIKNIPSIKSFKEQLKLFYLNELNSDVFCGRPYCKDCFSDN